MQPHETCCSIPTSAPITPATQHSFISPLTSSHPLGLWEICGRFVGGLWEVGGEPRLRALRAVVAAAQKLALQLYFAADQVRTRSHRLRWSSLGFCRTRLRLIRLATASTSPSTAKVIGTAAGKAPLQIFRAVGIDQTDRKAA